MTGIQLRVVDRDIMAVLDRIDRHSERPRAAMEAISGSMVTSVQRHFETEAGSDGKWPRLSARTASRRIGRRQRGYGNMLRVTNRLYQSIVGESSDTEATVGSNAVQAAIQNFGGEVQIPERVQDIHLGRTNRGKRFVRASARRKETVTVSIGAHTVKIPAREFLYLSPAELGELEATANDVFRSEVMK